ncbi:MAG: hypothetical protein IJQ72_01415 [Bacilli bacterium]|nr:hypothetical protein [Bacilli bacterium]
MFNIIRASLFKLFKDWTFRITMIVGLGLAGLLIGINAGIGQLNGHSMFLAGVSPSQNFGLTVPINLVVFTVSEFTFGTIRNKIIAGHSKFKIYTGLFLTGLVFTFSLMIVYLGLLVGISSAIGGFNAAAIGEGRFIGSYLAYFLAAYVFVTSLSVFFGALMRNIGGSISISVVTLVLLGMIPLIITLATAQADFTPENMQMWINPLYMIGFYSNSASIFNFLSKAGADVSKLYYQTTLMIIAGLLTPLYWSAIFFLGGAFIFSHRDIK